MNQVRELFHKAVEYLTKKGVSAPKLSVELLLSDVLFLKRMDLYLNFDKGVTSKETDTFREHIQQRARGVPVEYILQKTVFWEIPLRITPDVLIPRPETELLVHLIQKKMKENAPLRIADICTGSGCIALALKKCFPEAEVVAVDICEKALEVARHNGEEANLPVDWRCGSYLEPLQGEQFDIIVANPPYISQEEFAGLDRSVAEFEPYKALVPGKSGLESYETLLQQLKGVLKEGEIAFFEFGAAQKSSLESLLQKLGYTQYSFEKDWSGHDRFFFLENHPSSLYSAIE